MAPIVAGLAPARAAFPGGGQVAGRWRGESGLITCLLRCTSDEALLGRRVPLVLARPPQQRGGASIVKCLVRPQWCQRGLIGPTPRFKSGEV